jgi:hypothetical protein
MADELAFEGSLKQRNSQGKYMIVQKLTTELKPTCMIQVQRRYLAVASGFLNEKSRIDVVCMFSGRVHSKLEGHQDIIDSLRLVGLNKYTQGQMRAFDCTEYEKQKAQGTAPRIPIINPFISWLVSISRDNTMIVWKLFDGKPMYTDLALPIYRPSPSVRNSDFERLSVEDYF